MDESLNLPSIPLTTLVNDSTELTIISDRTISEVTGGKNIIIGTGASTNLTSGINNTICGYSAGKNNTSYNTFYGAYAGQDVTGNSNVLIGYSAGKSLTSISNKLIISNSDKSIANSLISGDFSAGTVNVKTSLSLASATTLTSSAITMTTTNTDYSITTVGTGGIKLVNSTSTIPTNADHLTTKSYVDNYSQGLQIRTECVTKTAAALATCTYSNGTSGVGATLTADANGAIGSVGGYAVSTSNRILVDSQSTTLQNGIYTVTQLGDGSNPWILTRATDLDGSPTYEVVNGVYTLITSGTYAAQGYTLTNTAAQITGASSTILLGTDPLIWTQFVGALSTSLNTATNALNDNLTGTPGAPQLVGFDIDGGSAWGEFTEVEIKAWLELDATAGTASASKFLITDGSNNLTGLNSLTLSNLTATDTIKINDSTDTYTTTLQGGAQVANITYTLPVNDGINAFTLTTNGLGVLSWTDFSVTGAKPIIPCYDFSTYSQSGLNTYLNGLPTSNKHVITAYAHGAGAITAWAFAGSCYSPTNDRIYLVPYSISDESNWYYINCADGVITSYAHSAGAITDSAFYGSCYSPTNDRIYLVPYSISDEATWYYINCSDGIITSYAHGAGAITDSAFAGAVYSPTQDRIYLVPWGISDEATWYYINCSDGVITSYAHGMGALVNNAYLGGVYSPTQNRIYFVPSDISDQTNWHYVDCSDGSIVAYAHATGLSTASAFFGGCYSPTQNRIYLVPSGIADETDWFYIDCDDGAVTSYAHGMGALTNNSYRSGVYHPKLNRIYFIPDDISDVATWHYIDCSDGTVVAYAHGMGALVDSAYNSGCYSPTENRIYLNPSFISDQATWHYISDENDLYDGGEAVNKVLMAGALFNKL